MTQREFIDHLRAGLTGKVSSGTVQENIYYYEQYFAEEIRKGRSEEGICAALGSPQLIVKGILEAERFQSEGGNGQGYQEDIQEERDYRSTGSKWAEHIREFQLPGWLMMMVTAFLFFFVISIVISVFSALAPLVIPVCIILFIVHIFKNNF